jgi:Family of unknown function (DUF5681)
MDGSGWVGGQAQRDRGGRFGPGVSGNPAGKRRGTLNRMTKLKLALDADESGAIARMVIDRALAGDMVAARFCLGLIVPKPRGREIELDLPECDGIEGILAAFDVTVAAMAAGDITPDEALTVSKVLDRRRAAIEAKARLGKRKAESAGDAAPAAAQISATEVPAEPAANAPADTVDKLEESLHSACKFGSDAPPPNPVATTAAPPRRPLPTFGSACIQPGPRRRIPSIAAALLSSAAYPLVYPPSNSRAAAS